MSDPFIKNSISDYTENEFVGFIDEIRKEDKAPTDDRTDMLILHLNKIAGHPAGVDDQRPTLTSENGENH